MHVGIIVYSRTGHTLSVAQWLEERLDAGGWDATLEQLEVAGPLDLSATTATLRRTPPVDAYDALVVGSPVNGGRMSAAMRSYLSHIPSLEGKPVALLLTHFFPRAWGANQTVEEMTAVCTSKGATTIGSGDVRWPTFRRRRQISKVVDGLSELLRVTAT